MILISLPPVQEDQDHRTLLLRDLKGNGKLPMLINASGVYEMNVTLRKKDLSDVRRFIRYGIFPMYKFVKFKNQDMKRETWDCVKNFKNE
eukprot:304453-Ditylum_brightwellii.AAC.1